MSSHPSDQTVATLIRQARTGAAAQSIPTRTRPLGPHSVRQHSAGSLIVETARADSGVTEAVAQERREVIATELERRRLVKAAEEARRQAERDRERAEHERAEAARQARQRGGPDPDFLTLALIAAVTFEVTDPGLPGVFDAAIADTPDLSADDTAELAGEPRVGLAPEQLETEMESISGTPDATGTMPQSESANTSPAVLLGQSTDAPDSSLSSAHVGDAEPDASPEIG